ncbi:hypothetical protein [Acuticoccus mangrovi]|uniref:DUF3168 domain-containing protein n=1 Tax=Acuticoccus mangrovi TaxID=2796142 RepID=A0A934MHS3_9HYPH|nr:hypothetical protein [Acuticoccus mangrovi]MBJ3776396.1 hypothetical protein [Acuticoccus mangrovi]
MPHVRQTIREAVETRVTGLPTTGANVFRVSPHAVGKLPALRVSTMDESVARHTMGIVMRTVGVTVTAFAKSGDDVEDALDAIAAEVEAAVMAGGTLGSVALDVEHTGTRKALGEDGEVRNGIAQLSFAVRYRTPEGAPTVAA